MEYAGMQENGSEAELGHVAPERQAAAVVAAGNGGILLLPDANNVVLLPEGATLDDISVRGRDLVITLDDGRIYVIADGAVFVPQIVIDGVSVPPMNLAALLTSEGPQPAAGEVASSGGNFADAVNPLQDAFELGDLLPYTELAFPEPREEEIYPGGLDRDEEPTISIITANQPAGVKAAVSTVHEAGLAARGNKPEGTDAQSSSETTTGTLVFGAPDGLASIALNGVVITGVGQTFTTSQGVLTITSISGGSIGYSYTLADNVLGTPVDEVFVATVTDSDGDTASATLTITIIDDAPVARPDIDSVTEDGPLVADGNVLTGTGGSDANTNDGVADTQGADGAVVATTGTFVGQYGTLVLNADGSYVYTLDNANPQVQALGVGETLKEVFPYTLRDGDGDTSATTLTITINGANDGVIIKGLDLTGGEVIVDEDNLASGSSPDAGALTQTGTFTVTVPDGLADVTVGGVAVVSGGVFTPQSITTPQGILTITGFTPTMAGGHVVGGTFTYSYELTTHTSGHGALGEDTVSESFPVVVTDRDGSSATASLDVTIVDDVPIARDDTAVSVAEDIVGTVGGNVLANDTQGADGATLTSVTIAGNITAIAPVGSTTVTTANGVYVFNANGDWSFDPVSGRDNASGTDASFTYVITDGDGDQATAAQPITIIEGAGPIAGDPITLALDDQNLATGSTPVNPDDVTASITFTPGSDAIVSIAFGTDLSGLGGGLTWTRISDTQITGTDGSRPVVTLDLVRVGDTAQVTATLDGNYDGHPGIDIDDVVALGNVVVVATDTDGGTATGTVNLSVSDDLPQVSATDALIKVTVDESDFTYDASASFAAAFSVNYGADGAGGVTYALAVTAGPSGLVDTTSGQPVVLSLTAGGVVEGRTGGGDLVFTVTVDGDGTVTLNQSRAVRHADANDHDDAATLSAADLVRLTATATDGDGDRASASVNIGDKLIFRDAGPELAVSVTDGDTILLTTQDAQTVGSASDTAVSSANFGGAFSVPYANHGADGAGTVSWSFALSVTNPASGLSSNGAAITLFLVDGVVIGSTAANADAINSGNTIFTLATNANGVVTLTQHAEIDHGLPGSGTSPFDTQLAVLGNGLVQLSGTATITDGDGDRASDTEHLDLGGNIRFADDGPSISASGVLPKVTVDETVLTTDASVSFASAFNVSHGADAGGSVTYALAVTEGPSGLIDLASGQPVVLSLTDGGVVEGRNYNGDLVFTVSVSADGTVTLDQQRALNHSDPSNPDDAVTLSAADLVRLTATVIDGDGDHASASVNIGDRLVFKDDGPVAVDDAPLSVVETAGLTVGTNLLLNDTLGTDNGRLTHVSFDGINWIGIDPAGTSIPIGGLGVYTISGNGDWTFDPVENSSTNHQDGSFQYRITDADGDFAIGHQAITVRTDGAPSTAPVTATVDDDGLPGGIDGGADDLNANHGADGVAGGGDDDLDGAASSGATFSGLLGISYGDDGAGTVSFAELHGQTVAVGVETATLAWNAARQTLTATGPRGELFVVELTDVSTGAYKVTLLDSVLHAPGDTENDATVALAYDVTDGNGTAGTGVLNIIFDDDKPGIFNTSDINLGSGLTSTGVFTYNIGADSRVSVSQSDGDFTSVALSGLVGSSAITNVATAKTGETATGASFAFSFNYDADPTLAGVQSATSSGSISFNKATGQYTVTLDQPLVNSDSVVTDLEIGVTITDADGDAVSSTLQVIAGGQSAADGSGLMADAAFSAERQSREAGRAVEGAAVAAAASALIAATLAADAPPAFAAVEHAAPRGVAFTAPAPVAETDYGQTPENDAANALLGDTGTQPTPEAPETTVNAETVQDTLAELARPVDHAATAPLADDPQSNGEAEASHALSDGAGTMQAMEALLALQAPPSSDETAPTDPQPADIPVVEEALGDARDAAFVDVLIDRLGGSADHAGQEAQQGADIAQVLSAHVDGGTVMVQSAFDLAQMAHDASAQAAAAHV